MNRHFKRLCRSLGIDNNYNRQIDLLRACVDIVDGKGHMPQNGYESSRLSLLESKVQSLEGIARKKHPNEVEADKALTQGLLLRMSELEQFVGSLMHTDNKPIAANSDILTDIIGKIYERMERIEKRLTVLEYTEKTEEILGHIETLKAAIKKLDELKMDRSENPSDVSYWGGKSSIDPGSWKPVGTGHD